MISREGMETALLLMQLRETMNLLIGAWLVISDPRLSIVPRYTLGLAVLVALIGLLVRLVVGQRRRWRERQRSLPELVEPRPAPEPPPRTRRKERARRRRELPEDTVRRWYAETLLELERRGVPKPAALTPGEYLQRAGEAYPASAGSLTALTRAYEDVRYGSRVISADRLGRLEAHRGVVLQTLRENG